MRKYYDNYYSEDFDYPCSATIHPTYHTSIGALTKMIDCCNGNIGKPKRIEKNSEVEKIFLGLRARKNFRDGDCSEGATT